MQFTAVLNECMHSNQHLLPHATCVFNVSEAFFTVNQIPRSTFVDAASAPEFPKMAAATPTETAAPASLGERGRSGSFRTSKVAEIMAPVVEATKKGWEVTAEGSKQAFAAAKPHFDLAGKVIAEKSTEAWTATVQGTTALVARARGMSATGAAATAGAPAAAAEGEEKKPEEAAKDVDSDADDEETKGKVEAAKAVAETKKEIATESAEEAERRRKEKLAKLQADAKAGLAKAGEATTNAFVSLG